MDAAKLRKAAVLPGHDWPNEEGEWIGETQHTFEAEFDNLPNGGLLLPAR